MDSLVTPAGTTGTRSPSATVLRIGVLVDRPDHLENWQLRIIDRILEDNRFCLASILVSPAPADRGKASKLLQLAFRLERSTLGRQPRYHPKHFSLADLPFEPVHSRVCDGSGQKLDLVLCLSDGGSNEPALADLRFGEWHFSFSPHASAGADWFGYAGVIERSPVTEMHIEVRRDGAATGSILATAAFNTKFSAVRNGDFIKERAVTLLMRELRRLADTGRMELVRPRPETKEAPRPPTGRQLARYAATLSRNLLARAVEAVQAKLGKDAAAWALYVGDGNSQDFDPRTALPVTSLGDEIRADPFLIEHEGQTYVFYEALEPGQTKAHIAVGRLIGNTLERLGVALKCHHHLSFPFVFRHDGQLFMMPETNQARRLEIWRCTEFPLRWELHSSALEGLSSADSTLTLFRGRWWLLTNISDFHAYEDHCSELHLFEVDGPDLKRVVPHRHNPVVIGSSVARNGGRPFEHAGKLFRPSQRNEHGIYGYGLNIMEIEQLDLETYRERCLRTIEPDFAPGLMACHHLDAAAGRYVIDVLPGRLPGSPR